MNGVTIENCIKKGIYATNFSKAAFTDCTFSGSGKASGLQGDEANARSGSAFDLNLVTTCESITFKDCKFTNNGDAGSTSGAIKIKVRGGNDETETSNYIHDGSITGAVSIIGCTFDDNSRDVVLGTQQKPKTSDKFTTIYSGGSPIREYNFAVNDSKATDGIASSFYANGNAVTISSDDSGKTKISWGDEKPYSYSEADAKKLVVFGGSRETNVSTSNITMNGGEVYYLVGGGFSPLELSAGNWTIPSNSKKSEVTTSNITVSGNSKINSVFGGGMGYATVEKANVTINGCAEIIYVDGGGYNGHLLDWKSNGYSNVEYGINSNASGELKDKFYNATNEAIVVINDGKIINATGGGRLGCTYVGETGLTVTGGQFSEIIAGGINGYTGTAKLTIEASSGKSITTGLISSGNRGQVFDVTVDIKSLGEKGKTDLVSIGALSGLTATDGGPNAIFDTINFTIDKDVNAANIYLGGAKWSKNETNPWDETRKDSLSATDITINAGGHKITAADIPKNATSDTYVGYADSATATSYTIGSEHTWTLTNGTLDLNLKEGSSITNNGTICYDSLNVDDDGLIIKNIQGGELQVKNTTFKTKGLFISGANNVTVTGCTFTGITESVVDGDLTQVNAIYLKECTGDVTIGDVGDGKNTIEDVVSSSDSNSSPQYGRGIFINCGGSGKSLTIQNNSISGTAYNALQLSNIEFTEITISNNRINNWDSDNDGVKDKPGSSDFSKGRAIRLNISENNSTTLTISDNKFTKTYTAGILYDNYNIIKISDADAKFTNNILVLSGLNDIYGHSDLFMTGKDDGDKYIVIFNPTDGYFKDSSETNELLYSITENGLVDEPTSPSRLGSYSFAGWYTDSILTTPFTDFTVPIDEDKTLYAKWTYTGGSGGYPVNPPVTPDEPETPIIPDSSGNAEIKVDDKKADELVHETVASGSNTLNIVDKDNVEGTVTSVSISVSDLETISKKIENNNNIDSISIATSEGEVIIEKEVLAEILENNAEADTLIIEVDDAKDKLTEEQKKTAGDNPVYDINLRLGDEYVTSFNGKSITVSIPYELKEGEDQNNLIVYYLKDDGSIEKMNCSYKDNQVSFETNHLSKFIIVYEAQEPIVPDNPDDKNDDNNSDNTIYYIIAAVIIILIIIALAYYFMKK